jgi:hypothetical protein
MNQTLETLEQTRNNRDLGHWPDNNILPNSGKDRASDCVFKNMKNVVNDKTNITQMNWIRSNNNPGGANRSQK